MPRVAVVGCGQWGINLVRSFTQLGALAAVSDLDPSRVAAARELLADVQAASLAEILNDDTISAVVIATPAGTHYALARDALHAGKDVLVEKPLALKVAQGAELVEEARKRGRILMVGHLLRYHPAIQRLKSLIDEGELGRIHYLYSNRLNLGRFRTEENILWSFAPHDVSAMLHLLGELPEAVAAQGGTYISEGIPDITVTTMKFRSGVKAHIFVSWLHPYKEQRLVVVGDRGMATFDDVQSYRKLVVLNHSVDWHERSPVLRKEEARPVPLPDLEPLRLECEHFLRCLHTRARPWTDGEEAVRVLQVLEACQESLDRKGELVPLVRVPARRFFAHDTVVVEEPTEIGEGTRIWHFCHVMQHARIGRDCSLGQNVFVGSDVVVGNGCRIQNNVSLYTGVILEDDVFCGPSVVFTNVLTPRSHIARNDEFRRTVVRRGASLGANSTVLCGNTIGRYAFVGAGATVTRDVPDYAMVVGTPARVAGWLCQCGLRLPFPPHHDPKTERAACTACGAAYVKRGERVTPAGDGEL